MSRWTPDVIWSGMMQGRTLDGHKHTTGHAFGLWEESLDCGTQKAPNTNHENIPGTFSPRGDTAPPCHPIMH